MTSGNYQNTNHGKSRDATPVASWFSQHFAPNAVLVGITAIGIGLGIIVMGLLGWSLLGVGVGAVVSVLSYAGASMLSDAMRSDAEDAVVEQLLGSDDNGEGRQALDAIRDATAITDRVRDITDGISDDSVSTEASGFIEALDAIIRYVRDDPAAWRALRKFTSTYGDPIISVLDNYADVEGSGAVVNEARVKTVRALRALEQAAAGELRGAASAKTMSISADSDAIVHLTSMSGYDADAAGDSTSVDVDNAPNSVPNSVPSDASSDAPNSASSDAVSGDSSAIAIRELLASAELASRRAAEKNGKDSPLPGVVSGA